MEGLFLEKNVNGKDDEQVVKVIGQQFFSTESDKRKGRGDTINSVHSFLKWHI